MSKEEKKLKKCEKNFDEFRKSLGVYEVGLKELTENFLMSNIKEKYDYPCSSCPWGYFSRKNEVFEIEIEPIKTTKQRTVYMCKNPKHEYLIAIDK